MPRLVSPAAFRLGAVLALGAAALACSSCGPAQKKVVPVEGKIFYNGKPAKGAYVFFHPTDNKDFTRGDQPRGVVGDDGSFHISTYRPRDGAPPGKYTVTVYWELKSVAAGDDGDAMPFLRYLSPATSPLLAEVAETPTVLQPYELFVDGAGQ